MNNVRTSSSCPGSVCRAFLVFLTDHNLIVLSLLQLTRKALSADHATWYTTHTIENNFIMFWEQEDIVTSHGVAKQKCKKDKNKKTKNLHQSKKKWHKNWNHNLNYVCNLSFEIIAVAVAVPDPTWELRVARNRPVFPHHNFTFLSNEAEARNRASGENAMWLTACWWPVCYNERKKERVKERRK